MSLLPVEENQTGMSIGRADQMNNFPKVMKNLGYSSEDAAASIKKISSALDGLPTTLKPWLGKVLLVVNTGSKWTILSGRNGVYFVGGPSQSPHWSGNRICDQVT